LRLASAEENLVWRAGACIFFDKLRQTELPKNGVSLIVLDYCEFKHTSSKRLLKEKDLVVIRKRLKGVLK